MTLSPSSAELGDGVADLFDHQIAGQVAVDLVDGFEALDAVADAGQDALGAFHQRAGAAVAGLDELQLARLEGVVDLVALFGELLDVLVEVGEAALQLLELDHHLAEVFLALVGRVAQVEVVDDGLAEQLHLRAELGDALAAGEFAAAVLERGADLVERRVDRRNVVDDLRGLRRVVDLQVADDVDEHFQLGAGLVEVFLDLVGLGDLGEIGNAVLLFADLGAVGIEGVGLEQEVHAVLADLGGGVFDVFLEGLRRRRYRCSAGRAGK